MEPNEIKLKPNPDQFQDIYSRETIKFPSVVDEEKRIIRGVIATELPAIVFDWSRWEPIREILLMKGANLPNKVPMLDSHTRFTVANIKGSVTNFKMEQDDIGSVITADHIFSSIAGRELTLAKEGHLDSTSIGYRVYPKDSVVLRPNQEMEIEGVMYKNNYGDDMDLIVRKRWDLMENSLVAIGADKAAKFRSMFTEQNDFSNELNITKEKVKQLESIINNRSSKMEEPKVTVNEEVNLVEKERKASIEAIARDFKDKVKGINLDEMKGLFLTSGQSAVEFGDLVTKNIIEQNATNKPGVDLTPKEKKQYSILNAIRYATDPRMGNCFEAEVSRELAKRFGKVPSGIFVPNSLMRDLTVGGDGTGEQLVGTDHLGSEFIEHLKNETVAGQLGVRFITNARGNIQIPKLTGGTTFGWAATENAGVSESTPTTALVEFSPKRGGTFVDISKTLMIQSDPSVEAIVRQDLLDSLDVAVDAAMFHGTGSDGQITGIAGISGIGDVAGASLSWEKALEFPSKVKIAKAAKLGSMSFVFNPTIESLLKSRPKEAGYPQYIMGENGGIGGYGTLVSNQVNDKYMFFGVWNQAIFVFWDAFDLTVDPYSYATTYLVRLTINQLCDFDVRHAGAFVVSDEVD
jgi:HK97 family phage major capsid protein